MSDFCIRIKSRPPGGAPPKVRDAWIGIVMPAKETDALLADVNTRRLVTDRVGGYEVQWDDAMNALGQKDVSARQWWEDNARFPALIFSPECCEIVPD